MATNFFTDAQSLTHEQKKTASGLDAATRDDSAAAQFMSTDSAADAEPLRLTQLLAGISLALGLAQVCAPRALGRLVGVGEYPALMRLLGVREIASGLGLLSRRQPARWSWARVAGDAIDLALLGAAAASAKRSEAPRLATAIAAVAGVTALDVYASRRLRGIAALPQQPVVVHQTLVVNADPATLYDFWSRFENLPRFMRHLESVTRRDERVSHWVARAPAGTHIEWDAEIVDDQPNRRIAWRTLPGSQVDHAGAVTFEPAPGGRGAQIRVSLRYMPPLGVAAVPIARLLGEEPSVQISEDLRRFKQLIETGEVASTAGQPTGRRSLFGHMSLGGRVS